MTREKLQFLLPVVFTVGPDVNQRGEDAGQAPRDAPAGHAPEDRGDALMKFAMLLADGMEKKDATRKQHIENIVKGIIEGETRVLVSSMTMEEIFTEREEFKRRIFRNIQSELDQFGLKIYNANVKELRDAPQSNYFESLSRKAHEGAINQARIDVAEAQRKGNVGEAQRQGEQNREIAKINAETAVQKTERDSEKAKAEATLATRKTAFNRDVNIAQIEATRTTEVRDEELRKAVEVKRAQTELERLRASDVVKATIARESKQQAADAKNYEEQARSNAGMLRLLRSKSMTDKTCSTLQRAKGRRCSRIQSPHSSGSLLPRRCEGSRSNAHSSTEGSSRSQRHGRGILRPVSRVRRPIWLDPIPHDREGCLPTIGQGQRRCCSRPEPQDDHLEHRLSGWH